ncbi:unnamed protein product [Ectocarpus sp. 12 AP-2014]
MFESQVRGINFFVVSVRCRERSTTGRQSGEAVRKIEEIHCISVHRGSSWWAPPSEGPTAIEIEEKTLGPDHPSVATRLNNRASLLESQVRAVKKFPGNF